MKMIPATEGGYALLHEGVQAFADIESNGICIDVPYLNRTIKKTERRITRLERQLHSSKVFKVWKRMFGNKTNLSSGEQLGKVLFDEIGHKSPGLTKSGQHKTDEESLAKVKDPFVADYLNLIKLRGVLSKNLRGLLSEVTDGKIHSFFNLHTARTYRSSSERPNFQNQPIRDPDIGRLVRSCFIPRRGRKLVEADYSGIEVRVAACYHKDPRMIEYIVDTTKDMHRDMAMECYLLQESDVNKSIRYCGKNMFVFPQFYGSWWRDCSLHLWEAIHKMNLKTASGVPLLDHLRSKGIKKLGQVAVGEDPVKGTFAHHIMQVERHFWNVRFKQYSQWKKDWWQQYLDLGYLHTLTGFVCSGFMRKNEVINYPIQGSAFHCLLWSLIRIVRYELKRRKMKSLVIGQIHDSILGDVVPEEEAEFVHLVHHVMTVELPKVWRWLCVPLEIEVDVSPVDCSWAEKEEVSIPRL